MTTAGRIAAAIMGLAAGLGGVMTPGVGRTPIRVTTPVVRMTRRMLMRMTAGPVVRWGYSKPQQTVAQNQRASIKAKHRARHRAACRG